jgi:filamentous hemagglutinin
VLNSKAGNLTALATSSDALDLNITGSLNNAGFIATNAAAWELDAGSITNSGTLQSAGTGAFTLNTGALSNSGSISGRGSSTLSLASLNNAGGTLSYLGDITLNTQGGAVDNTGGNLFSAAVLRLTSGNFINRGGLIQGDGQNLYLTTRTLDNRVNAGSAGRILHRGSGTLTVSGTAVTNDGGKLQSAGSIDADLTSLSNSGGIVQANNVDVQTTTALTNGTLAGVAGLINAMSSAASALKVTVGTLFNNNGGLLQSSGGSRLNAATLTNTD